jgi:hypothetical protein
MFGYVVQTLDIPNNTDQIDKLQSSLLNEATATKFVLKQNYDSQSYVYVCEYVSHIGRIELSHLFFDFANAIRKEAK